jgi:hypothetical protein
MTCTLSTTPCYCIAGPRSQQLSTFWQSLVLHCRYFITGDSGDLKRAVLGSDLERSWPELVLSSLDYYLLPALLQFVILNILLAIVFEKFAGVKTHDPYANDPWKLETEAAQELQYIMCAICHLQSPRCN